mmetsp:Transcript_18535/g.30413  ORF Transcript_18535/g.30413 Transcript_18535/m.30413 type:complete len:412 (+) Transcript_18535:11784-13019(+)
MSVTSGVTSTGTSSSAKSIVASISAAARISLLRHCSIRALKSPDMPRIACRRCASVSDSIRSASPSTWARSILLFSKARRVNSPGSAMRALLLPKARKTADTTATLPCKWNSTVSSPVKLAGSSNFRTRAWSNPTPSVSQRCLSAGMRPIGKVPQRPSATTKALGPESRTTATPALPCAVASAKIVSIALPSDRYQVFIESKKSAFVLVCFNLEIRNSIASVVPIGLRIRRSTKVLARSPLSTNRSSFRVPDFRMSIAGKTRLSAILRSSTISELPVPLNSSKITSSIRLPVSIRAVAIMVKEPPSSIFRAAPKNRLGRCRAFASTPPVKTLPEDGTTVLKALPSLVIESRRITTSRLCSTKRLAFSMTISETATCRVAGSSKVELTTSPFTDLCMSVTSSGRSSIKRTIR